MTDNILIRVVDLETTGLPPDAEVIEIAAVDVRISPFALPRIDEGRTLTGQPRPMQAFVCPPRPIPPEASAVHHIIDGDVAGALPWCEVWPGFISPAVTYYCAHSAKFERAFIPDIMTDDRPWICTWKCALRLWPDAPKHSNQALRYWLKRPGLDRSKANLAHRAWPDAYVTAHLLAAMLECVTAEQLVAWSAEPAILPRITFGKLRGRPWSDADGGLLHWVIDRDFDEDVKFTVRAELERRRQAQAQSQGSP